VEGLAGRNKRGVGGGVLHVNTRELVKGLKVAIAGDEKKGIPLGHSGGTAGVSWGRCWTLKKGGRKRGEEKKDVPEKKVPEGVGNNSFWVDPHLEKTTKIRGTEPKHSEKKNKMTL